MDVQRIMVLNGFKQTFNSNEGESSDDAISGAKIDSITVDTFGLVEGDRVFAIELRQPSTTSWPYELCVSLTNHGSNTIEMDLTFSKAVASRKVNVLIDAMRTIESRLVTILSKAWDKDVCIKDTVANQDEIRVMANTAAGLEADALLPEVTEEDKQDIKKFSDSVFSKIDELGIFDFSLPKEALQEPSKAEEGEEEYSEDSCITTDDLSDN